MAVRTGAGRRSGLDPKEQQAPKDGRGCGRAFCDCGCGCDWWVCGGVARSIKASPLPVGWVLAAVGARAPPHLSAALVSIHAHKCSAQGRRCREASAAHVGFAAE